jgi:hypothetical protein
MPVRRQVTPIKDAGGMGLKIMLPREELEEGIGRGEARPLTRGERQAAARDRGPANTVYAPPSERVRKPPLPADEKLISHNKDDTE